MDHKGDPQPGTTILNDDELPQMDGSCDACEPDEAQTATLMCHKCSFAFCSLHAERHTSSTRHTLAPYNHDTTQAEEHGSIKDYCYGHGADGEAGIGANQRLTGANIDVNTDAGLNRLPSGLQVEPVVGEGAMGADAGLEALVPAGQKRDTVTVERLRCMEHEQEGSLYCKMDEKIICVVCAVQGEHQAHEIVTLHEAYLWQKGRQGYDLLGSTQQMAEKIKTKWTNPEMSTEELEDYVNTQFDELRELVRLEEKRTLHLVDLKEASLTASAAEKIAEISLETERLQEEMANITNQLCMLEQGEAGGDVAAPGPAHREHRVQPGDEARPSDQQLPWRHLWSWPFYPRVAGAEGEPGGSAGLRGQRFGAVHGPRTVTLSDQTLGTHHLSPSVCFIQLSALSHWRPVHPLSHHSFVTHPPTPSLTPPLTHPSALPDRQHRP